MIAPRFLLAMALAACAACGGVTQFSGAQAFAITGAAAPQPVAEQPRVELRDNKIEIKEKIQFEANKANIKSESNDLLHEIAEVIRKNPQVKKIMIEGHASAEGNDDKNLKLSRSRAKAVRKHLIKREGIPAEMLSSQGWGEDKPIADNETLEGREKNRRVEFLVVEQDVKTSKVEIDQSGKEKVVEEKSDTVKREIESAPRSAKGGKAKE
jgi:OOP family OmpA-OmpF porin